MNFQAQDFEGFLLHMAVVNGDYKALEMAIGMVNEWQVDTLCEGVTPLLLAVSLGHTDMVKLLLECGADLNRNFDFFRSPWLTAAWTGTAKMVELLLTCGRTVNVKAIDEDDFIACLLAAENPNPGVMWLLIAGGVDHETVRERGRGEFALF